VARGGRHRGRGRVRVPVPARPQRGEPAEAGGGAAVADALAPLGRSVLLAASVALAAAALGTALAWLVERTDLPGRRVLRLLLPLPLVIPRSSARSR